MIQIQGKRSRRNWTVSQAIEPFIIAYRLSTVVNASAIIVMDRGRIVERGSHAELLRRKGMYAQPWLPQQRMDRDLVRRAPS